MSRISRPKRKAVAQVQQGRARPPKDDPWAREVNDVVGAGCGLAVKYEEQRFKADDGEDFERPKSVSDTSE